MIIELDEGAAMAEALITKVVAWEKERGAKFEYDGVSECCSHGRSLPDGNLTRLTKEMVQM